MAASLPPASGLISRLPAYGQRIALMGDSIGANGGIPPSVQRGTYGYGTWLTALLGERLNQEVADNFSVSGTTTAHMLNTQLPQALASDAAWVVVEGGNNDIGGSIQPATTVSNMTAVISALLSAGKRPIVIGPMARGSSAYTQALKDAFNQINQGLRYFMAHNPGAVWIDTRAVLADQLTGYAITSMTQGDGIHPNAVGAKTLAGQVVTAISGAISPYGGPCMDDPFDLYSSSANPVGNLLTNGGLTTTTGGTINTGTPSGVMTGTIASGWIANYLGKAGGTYTGTMVASVVSRSDAQFGKLQQFTATNLAGGNTSDFWQFQQNINFPTGLAPGDQVYFACDCIMNHTNGFTGHQILLKETDGSGIGANDIYYKAFDTPVTPWPTGSYSLALRTPLCTIRAANGGNTRSLTAFFQIGADASTGPGANFTIQLGRLTMRKVKP